MPDRDPVDWQEPHSPTVPVTVTVSKQTKRTATIARRRFLDARLWHSLAVHKNGRGWNGCEAAAGIRKGCALVVDGPPVRAHSWERRDPTHKSHDFADEAEWRCYDLFWKWGHEVPERYLIMCILIDGYSCRAMDRAKKRGHGWSQRRLVKGLQLYCDLAGWPR